MGRLPSKKITEPKEEPKKLKTTGRVAKPKTVNENVVKKTTTPKKKGEKKPSVVTEVKANVPKEVKVTKTKSTRTRKTPIKVTEDHVTKPVDTPVPLMERVGPSKTKRFKEDRYVKISTDASKDDFAHVGRRVQNGELQWAFYATTSETEAHHYYLDLTKK